MKSPFPSTTPARAARRLFVAFAAMGLASLAPAHAGFYDPNVVFDTATASVQKGLLEHGPNLVCDVPHPGAFSFRNGDPNELHLYKSYDLYNDGPERCVTAQLDWAGDDCGDLEIGIGIYLGSFNPNDPTQNLIAHSYRGPFQTHIGNQYNDYFYSPGYYRDIFNLYSLEHLDVAVTVPAYAKVVVVLDSPRRPSDPPLVCPRPSGSLNLVTTNLQAGAPEITVNDASNFEFGPLANQGGKLQFNVHLSVKAADPVTVHYKTNDGTAVAGVDYLPVDATLTFQPGETFKFVDVDILGDATLEADKSLTLTLDSPNPPAIAITDATAIGTIQDDDSLVGTCHIASPGALPPGIAGQPYGPVDLVPDGEVAGDFAWSLVDPSCLPPNLTLSEGAGEHGVISGTPTVSGTFSCTIHLVCPASDSSTETHDTPFTLVIEPEAPQVLITLEGASTLEGDTGNAPVLPHIHLSSPAATAFNLEVVLFDLSATVANIDYVPLGPGQQIGINAGDIDVPIPLDAVGDEAVEPDELFLVQIRTPTTHEVLDTAEVAIINDDAPISVETVPTLGEWGLLALAIALGVLGVALGIRNRALGERPRH
jgi:hypothetical protein